MNNIPGAKYYIWNYFMVPRKVIIQKLAPSENQSFNFQAIKKNDYFCIMSDRDKIIKKIIRVANKNYPDSEIYLYGSRARGDAKSLSDWDLLILLNSKSISFDFETRLMDEFYELELETGEIISPLIYSKIDWANNHSLTSLYENVQKEGIKIK